MMFSNGLWHWRGQTYTTLHEALLAVWAERRRTK